MTLYAGAEQGEVEARGGVSLVHGRSAAVFECLGGKEKRVGYNLR
jgi:hypothetical protein